MRHLTVRVHRLPHALDLPMPAYATGGASGIDLCAAIGDPVELAPGQRVLVPTGLRVAIPEGFEGQVRARSGLALKRGLGMVNAPGTIDSDYRGEIGVILINWSAERQTIRRGERVAQLVFAPVARAEMLDEPCLDETDRGAGGFGHTGA
jgi:dUTP pyrophosphatase